MLENLQIDQEFTQAKIEQMADSFVKYVLEMAELGEKINEDHMDALLEIVLIKYGTNMELSDDINEIVMKVKELNLDSILKQFPESEVQRAFEHIKLALTKVEEQIQNFMEKEEYTTDSCNNC